MRAKLADATRHATVRSAERAPRPSPAKARARRPEPATTAPVRSIDLNGRRVDYRVRTSDRSRYARLKISRQHGLEVILPSGADARDVPRLLAEKQAWILAKLEEVQNPAEAGAPALTNGSVVSYLGRPHRVEVSAHPGRGPAVRRLGDCLQVTLPDGDDRLLAATLEAWYRLEARRIFLEQVEDINRSFGFTYQRLTIKGQRSRWGSCSDKRNLNFNWRLVMAPLSVIRYVVTHELAHLGELNHSPRFWALVESRCPSYRAEQEWLKRHGASLGW